MNINKRSALIAQMAGLKRQKNYSITIIRKCDKPPQRIADLENLKKLQPSTVDNEKIKDPTMDNCEIKIHEVIWI